MTRKRFNKLTVALCEKIQMKYNGEHLKGDALKFYRDKEHRIGNTVKFSSYAEAWESLKSARELVGM